jgi:hypothetical protein
VIPTVEDILHMVAKGECTHEQALAWMEEHFRMYAEQLETPAVQELRAALLPFVNYIDKFDAKPIWGLGDAIHTIHGGTEWEAEITREDCRRARIAWRKFAP